MTARALRRETLIAAFAATPCPDGAVRINAQLKRRGGRKKTKSQAPPLLKKANPTHEIGKKNTEQMQTCSCPNCILQSTSSAAGFPSPFPVFPVGDGVGWFSLAAGFAW